MADLRYAREKSGLSQKELAQRSKMSKKSLIDYEKKRNSSPIEIDKAIRLASILGYSAESLFEDISENSYENHLLKQERSGKGMSVAEVAQKAGIAACTYYQYERLTAYPDKQKAEKIALALGVDPEAVFPDQMREIYDSIEDEKNMFNSEDENNLTGDLSFFYSSQDDQYNLLLEEILKNSSCSSKRESLIPLQKDILSIYEQGFSLSHAASVLKISCDSAVRHYIKAYSFLNTKDKEEALSSKKDLLSLYSNVHGTLKEELRIAMESLTTIQKKVITRLFFMNDSVRDIAKKMKMSHQNVYCIRNSALSRLRKHRQKLEPFLQLIDIKEQQGL